jgi:hypothetical protein
VRHLTGLTLGMNNLKRSEVERGGGEKGYLQLLDPVASGKNCVEFSFLYKSQKKN